MIDSTYVKAHQHSCGARGGNQAISKTKGGLIQKYTTSFRVNTIYLSKYRSIIFRCLSHNQVDLRFFLGGTTARKT